MSLADPTPLAGCPACPGGAPLDALPSVPEEARADHIIALPGIHCAGCITGVERVLMALPGVHGARVNLSRRRVSVVAAGVPVATLIAALEARGYEAHELDADQLIEDRDGTGRELLMCLGVSGFAAMNVMLLSVAVWSGASDATRDLFHWISAAIAIPTVGFSARPFFRSALSALSGWRLNMDVPISLAILLAVVMSLAETAQGGAHAYFDAALSLTFFLLAGRYLDHRSRAAARSAAAELAALEVPRATRLAADGSEETVPVADLCPGDRIALLPGARVPADGEVLTGESEIDRALLTGETVPEAIGPGQTLSAGAVNLTGPLTLRVTSRGTDTSLRRMAELVAAAELGKTRHRALADRAAAIYAPVVHLLALFAFIAWVAISGDLRFALNVAVAVLIITCPCALGLAVPAVATAAAGALFRRGLLVKDGTALERLAECDTVVFDKTGTLTLGTPALAPGTEADGVLKSLALALARGSHHPLSTALVAALSAEGISAADGVSRLREVPGRGVEADWQGQRVRYGRPAWALADGSAVSADGPASVLALADGRSAIFRFEDVLRPGAGAVVERLRGLGLDVLMLSGDGPGAVRRVADSIGIARWEAELLPEEKAAFVDRLRAEGRRVAMVGDGLNDTVALAAAHTAISPASALDAARVVSDIVLLGRDLQPIAHAVTTARSASRRIVENFAIAASYNTIAVPLAVTGFATPLMAALAMSSSSVLVTLNALRLR